MKTPLKLVRERKGQTIVQVAHAVGLDGGNLSRVENCKQKASLELAEKLAQYFEYAISEIEILYPERFMVELSVDAPVAIVVAGQCGNQLQWVSPLAMSQVPPGTELFVRPAQTTTPAPVVKESSDLAARHQQAIALLEQAAAASQDLAAIKEAIALLSQPQAVSPDERVGSGNIFEGSKEFTA